MKSILKKTTGRVKYFIGKMIVMLILCFLMSTNGASAQSTNSDFERIKLQSQDNNFSGITISPDGNQIAISSKKSIPVKIIDTESRQLIKEINAGDWYSGSKISFSSSGKYLLLQELDYNDFSLNKPRNIGFEIVDVSTGSLVRKFENVQDVFISEDEKYALCYDDQLVHLWNLSNGAEEKSIQVKGAANSIALSHDGRTLAVSETISPEILKNNFGKDKKAAKSAEKYKQVVSLYEVSTGSLIKTISEFYDIIYKLKFTPGGEFIIVSQTPEITTQVPTNKISFMSLIDVAAYEPVRKGFTSMSINQPAMHFSHDQKFFAINSKGSKFQEIHLYDSETGTLQQRFELGKRIFEKVEGEKLFTDSRPTFCFLPNNQSIVIAMGNQLVVWNFENNL